MGGYAVVMTGLITLLVMGVLESCNMVNLPPIAEHGGLAKDECYAMTTAMMKAAPRGEETAGEILALFFHVVFRIEQNFFLCSPSRHGSPSSSARRRRASPSTSSSPYSASAAHRRTRRSRASPSASVRRGLELSDAAKASITLPFIPVWSILGVLNALAFLGAKEKSA